MQELMREASSPPSSMAAKHAMHRKALAEALPPIPDVLRVTIGKGKRTGVLPPIPDARAHALPGRRNARALPAIPNPKVAAKQGLSPNALVLHSRLCL